MTTEAGSDPETLTAQTDIYDRFHSRLTTEYVMESKTVKYTPQSLQGP